MDPYPRSSLIPSKEDTSSGKRRQDVAPRGGVTSASLGLGSERTAGAGRGQ